MQLKYLLAIILTTISLLGSQTTIAQKAKIYNADAPTVVPVWHRIGDYSPILRAVESAELSPDGRIAVSVSKFDGMVMAWRTADGTLLYQHKQTAEIECIVFSPDGKQFATGGEDYFVRLYETATGKVLKEFENDNGFDGIAWSPDGKTIAGGSEKGDAVFLDAETLKEKWRINVGSTINSMQFTQDNTRLAVAGNNQIPDPTTKKTVYKGFASLIDVAAHKVMRQYVGPRGSQKSIRISGDQKVVASCGFDSTAYVFDLESGKLLHEFNEPKRLEALAFSPDDNFLITGGHQLSMSFYRLRDFVKVHELPCPRTEYIAFSADGRQMLSAHEDSGLISLYLFLSDMQDKGDLYHRLEETILNNRDLKK